MANVINTLASLINVLSVAKNGGQFASIEYETPIRLNKFPTDGSERVRLADGFAPTNRVIASFHFGEDYERAMARATGVSEYTAKGNGNTFHIVTNLLMQYISTGNVCVICIPSNYKPLGTFVNGHLMTDEEKAYMGHYKPKSSNDSPLDYRTIGIKNVRRVTFGGVTYEVDIKSTEYTKIA